MSETPELDQIAYARRRMAMHAQFPTVYWAVYAIALVGMAGLPIWMALTPSSDYQYFQWVIAGVALGSVLYSWWRRRSSGVYLPKRISAYPTARRTWLIVTIVTAIALLGIWGLVRTGHLGIAALVLLPVAAAVVLGQLATRSAMMRDIEAGRVSP